MAGFYARLKAAPEAAAAILRLFGAVALLGSFEASAATAQLPKLPVIQNVGVVPVQWEGDSEALTGKQALDEAFPKSVRGTRRFRVLSDDLVSGLWNTVDGRAELRSQFELHGFLSLTVTPRGDTIALTARLMDSSLKTDLLESDQVTADWLANAEPKAVQDRLDSLVFRLVNRIPVDVSVTSVQGAYLTLSGGAEQGVEAGDKVDLVRASVRALHPANGTWLEFQKQPLGTAQVVEVKEFTSVAKITGQTYDNAIQIGDGARIGAIASRVKFARLAENEGFKDSGDPSTIIVPPLYNGPAPAAAKPVAKPAAPAAAPQEPAVVAAAEPNSQPSEAAPPAEAPVPAATNDAPPPATDSGPNLWDDVTNDVVSHKFADEIVGYAGPYWWHMGIPGSSGSGKFPMWLVNSVGGGITHTLLYKFKTAFGGGLLFGQTDQGSYTGYDSYARIYWEDALDVEGGLIKGWHAGGAGTFSGLSVEKGHFGGGDWIRGGVFGGLFGTVHAGPGNDRYDWFGDFTLTPLNLGRIGYSGNQKTIDTSRGYKISAGAYQFQPARMVQWGGGFDYGRESMTVKGARPVFTETSLKLLAKYAF